MNRSLYKAVAVFGLIVLAMNANAQQGKDDMGMGNMGGMQMDCMKNMKGMKMDCMENNAGKDASKAVSMSDGEVKAVDTKNKTITLKHGPIKSKTVEMGAMTMNFPVQSPSLLSNVKVGNKVKFIVENVNNVATVTTLVVQK